MSDFQIVFLKRSEIDEQKWQNCIERSSCPLLYVQTWYLDAVCPDWCAFAEIKNDAYFAVMPLPVRKKFGIAYLEQPLYSQQYGLFAPEHAHTRDRYAIFLSMMLQKFSLISRYAFHYKTPSDFLPKNLTEKQLTHHIDLSQNFEEIFASFRKDRKRDYRKKDLFEFEQLTSAKSMCDIFFATTAKKIKGGVNPKSEEIFLRLFDVLTQHCETFCLKGFSKDGIAEEFALFVKFSGTVYYLFNAAKQVKNSVSIRAALIADILSKTCGDAAVFDFESAQEPSVADFYASFGARKMPFFVLSKDDSGFIVRMIRCIKRNFFSRL